MENDPEVDLASLRKCVKEDYTTATGSYPNISEMIILVFRYVQIAGKSGKRVPEAGHSND